MTLEERYKQKTGNDPWSTNELFSVEYVEWLEEQIKLRDSLLEEALHGICVCEGRSHDIDCFYSKIKGVLCVAF